MINYCEDFKLLKPSYQEAYGLLFRVVIGEKIKIKESELKELYGQSNGDIRYMLNTLQFGRKKGGEKYTKFKYF